MIHVGQWDGTCRIVSKGGGVVEFVEKWRIMRKMAKMADNGEKWQIIGGWNVLRGTCRILNDITL